MKDPKTTQQRKEDREKVKSAALTFKNLKVDNPGLVKRIQDSIIKTIINSKNLNWGSLTISQVNI